MSKKDDEITALKMRVVDLENNLKTCKGNATGLGVVAIIAMIPLVILQFI